MEVSKSPKAAARIAGLLYLVIIVAAPVAEMIIPGRLVVAGDPAATAANILQSEQLFRLGGVASLITVFCDVALAALFYLLLRPVSGTIALVADFFRLAAITVVAVNVIFYFAPLTILKSDLFAEMDRAALALLAWQLHAVGYNVVLLVFGGHCLLLGHLVARATFLPRVIGWILTLAGVCDLANWFAVFAAPAFAHWLGYYVLIPPLVGELGLALWLLIAGVDAEKWSAQANAAR
jgi:hypothetical protein